MKPTSGYSGTPLIKKLGYRPAETVCVLNAPTTFKDYLLANDTKLVKQLPADWLQVFCKTQADLAAVLQTSSLEQVTHGCWLCWPKRSSGLQADLIDQQFRDRLLPLGWVDTKVCAVDESWSALKFLRRKTLT